jgi:LysM repeat protein
MKGRHWSIIAILVLLNYLVFSQLIVFVVESTKPEPTPTRTPKPTFTATFTPSPIPPTPPTPTPGPLPTPTATLVVPPTDTPTPEGGPTSTPPPEATATPVPVETRTGRTTHVVQPGENLAQIAQRYGVSVEAIVQANGLEDPSFIYTGQNLIIPAPGEVVPTATPRPPTATPQPAPPTAAPPTATEIPPTAAPVPTTPPSSQYQYRLGRAVTCTPNCGTTGVKGVVYDVNAN